MAEFVGQYAALFRGAPRRLQLYVLGSAIFAVLASDVVGAKLLSIRIGDNLSTLPRLTFAVGLVGIVLVMWNKWVLEGSLVIWQLTVLSSFVSLIQFGVGVVGPSRNPRVGPMSYLPAAAWSLFTIYAFVSPASQEYRKGRVSPSLRERRKTGSPGNG